MKKYISPILLLIAAIIWGFAFSAQKSAADVPPFTIGAVRSSFATVFLFIIIPMLDKAKKNGRKLVYNRCKLDFTKYELIGGALTGSILTAASALQQSGIGDGTDAGKASFITALYVVIVPIYGIFIKRHSPLNVWLGVGIAVVGFYFLCIDGSFGIAPSDLLVLLCALVFALHILTIDHFSPKTDGVRMSCIQFAVATVLNLILAFIFESSIDLRLVWDNILPLLFLGIGSSGIAYTLQIVGQKGVNPALASLLLSLESVFGVVGSAIFLNETMKAREYIGCAIVFVAVILAELDFKAIFNLRKARKNKI